MKGKALAGFAMASLGVMAASIYGYATLHDPVEPLMDLYKSVVPGHGYKYIPKFANYYVIGMLGGVVGTICGSIAYLETRDAIVEETRNSRPDDHPVRKGTQNLAVHAPK